MDVIRAFLFVVACGLPACAPPSFGPAPREPESETAHPTPATFKDRYRIVLTNNVDRSSPDRAVETRWGIQDELQDLYCEAARAQEATFREWRAALEETSIERNRLELTGDALAQENRLAGSDLDCASTSYRREIEEARVETETRAIVLVRVWNTTPLPEAVQLDRHYREEREGGTRYRYTMSRVGDVWMVANIDEYDNTFREWRDRTTAIAPVYEFRYATTVP